MQIVFVRKTDNSGVEHCPAIYRTTDPDGWVVQGKKLSRSDRRKLRQLGRGERGVWIPPDLHKED
jgi:hypothetical protein